MTRRATTGRNCVRLRCNISKTNSSYHVLRGRQGGFIRKYLRNTRLFRARQLLIEFVIHRCASCHQSCSRHRRQLDGKTSTCKQRPFLRVDTPLAERTKQLAIMNNIDSLYLTSRSERTTSSILLLYRLIHQHHHHSR